MGLINITNIPAVYINLEKHKEKNDSMCNLLSSVGFKTIERIEGVLDVENSVAGCSKAHYKALSSFKAPFVLFEDDCVLFDQNTITEIEIPDNADALYLGISSWGRMNGHNGFYLQYDEFEEQSNLLRIYNMLGGHSVIYLTEDYRKMCEKVSYHAGYVIKDYQDVGFAEIQKFFNVYSLNYPMFYQTSNALGTKNNITSYHTSECLSVNNLNFYPYKIK
jgi:hypothetical protein